MSMGETEARIRRLHARLGQAEARTESLTDRSGRLEQNLAGFFQVGADFGGCTTTITGKIIGGDAAAAPLAGSTLTITGVGTGIAYGTFVLSSGTYSIGLSLDPADTTLALVATGPGARFTTGTPVNRGVTLCATNALANVQATPAAGYHYFTGAAACQYPVKNTLSWTESALFGAGTLTWAAGAWSFLCQNHTSVPGGLCGISVTAGIYLGFDDGVITNLTYPTAGPGNNCPAASLCPSAGFAIGSWNYGFTVTRSITCPDNVTLFAVTFSGTVPAGHIWLPAGPWSIIYYET